MGPIGDFQIGSVELWSWGLQFLLIALVVAFPKARISLPTPSMSFCLLMIAAGWILRLAYLYTLGSGGFLYWVGDDPLRWLAAWEWVHGLDGEAQHLPQGWLPGSTYLHGLAMMLIADPLNASKLVASFYPAMSLVAVFAFAQAVFRHRGFSAVCAVFIAPFWIHILLSSGMMTEMPTVGGMVAGAAALISAMRSPLGRRRTRRLLLAGICFAFATMFHLVAWIQLTGILLFVLPVFLREKHGSAWTRFRAWVVFCALSTSYCFVWLGGIALKTGNPLSPFTAAISIDLYKIGGTTRVLEFAGRVATVPQGLILGAFVVSTCLVIGLRWARSSESMVIRARFDDSRIRRAGVAAWILLVLFAGLSVPILADWHAAIPPQQRAVALTNWFVYPVSLAYCLFNLLPIAAFGIAIVLAGRGGQGQTRRVVFFGVLFSFSVLISTSVLGGANLSPFRTVLSFSTALIPFALAPFFALEEFEATESRGPTRLQLRGPQWVAAGIVGLLLVYQLSTNHQRIFHELPVPSILVRKNPPMRRFQPNADTYALGAWMKHERKESSYLSHENFSMPFVLVLEEDLVGLRQMIVQYHVGDPGLFTEPERILERTAARNWKMIGALREGQVLIADFEVNRAGLDLIVTIGRFRIYEYRP